METQANQGAGPPKDKKSWDARYVEGNLPWDSGETDTHLQKVVADFGLKAGKAIDIGCGTGTNAIWLAKQGFAATGLDLAPTAIEMAKAKVAATGESVEFHSVDFLKEEVPGGPFDFAYDRGCLHTFAEDEDRARFAERLAAICAPGAIWHSLIGSTDGPPRDSGPPRRSAAQITAAIEPYFEILELRATTFDTDQHAQASAWVMVARRRDTEQADGA